MSKQAPYANRIVGQGEEKPDQLLANPRNWRAHPKQQQQALEGALSEVGWVQQVVVNQQTGHLVDGHLRVSLALRRNEPTVPVLYVDLSPEEEAIVLATLDPIGAMAQADKEKLDELLRDVATGDEGLMQMLADLAADAGIVPADGDWSDALGGLPEGDKAPFQQMTFTVSDSQAEMVKEALATARDAGPFVDADNENSNGNALARICEAYLA